MSAVVGSTPSLTRRGRPSASFSRSSASLMICAAPFFRNAKASSGRMIRNCSRRRPRRQRFPTIATERAAGFTERAIYSYSAGPELGRSSSADFGDPTIFDFFPDLGTDVGRRRFGSRSRCEDCWHCECRERTMLLPARGYLRSDSGSRKLWVRSQPSEKDTPW